jgi:hypothetical protein
MPTDLNTNTLYMRRTIASNPLDDHRVLRAEIIVREYGEPERYQTIGPFSPYDPDASGDECCAWLEDVLRRQGDDVVRVWCGA